MGKVTSKDIKFALLWYFRWTRNMLCATECMSEDVMAFKGNRIYECEVKISKSDLWNGEAKKPKHRIFSKFENGELSKPYLQSWYVPNMFYVCVPENLKDEAIKWCESVNPKYGVMVYRGHYDISVERKAQYLHKEEAKDYAIKALFMRVCCENILFKRKELGV